MKKTMRSLACLMAIVLLLSSVVTYAADQSHNIHLVNDEATVYVDNVRVKNIQAYTDGFGVIRVDSTEDLKKIFPGRDFPTMTGIIVEEWVLQLGYTCTQEDSNLYIYTNGSTVTLPENPSIPTTPESSNVEVFVNGLRIDNPGVNTYGGEFFISTANALYKLFPKETANTHYPAVMETSSLRNWATKFKYTMVSNENRVYLNNSNRAIEITLNGKLVYFADQQPMLTGDRTMVPIRAIAEMLDCTVEWDANNKRIVIHKGTSSMVLWVGYSQYWFNNHYYTMDVAPTIVNTRTMVPIRFVAEAFGFKVVWDDTGSLPIVQLHSK